MSERPLLGKVAVVTGGARGIGAAIATRLARAGARVTITYNASGEAATELVAALEREGCSAWATAADSASPEAIRAAVVETVRRSGSLDVLVNNASLGCVGRIEDLDLETFDRVVAVNIRGTFYAIKEALPHMNSGGRVINIGSVSSDYMPSPGHSVYVMTKGAIKALTRGLTRELAERGIRINTVQPGRIVTEMMRQALGDHFEDVRRTMPLGRFGQVDEAAMLVQFLCERGGDFITGADIRVDGGVSA